jgi:ATP-dependent RNA helicase DeaD
MMSDTASKTFADLGLRKELLDTLGELGYEAPTPIQEKTVPVLLEGRDLIGQAQTGTGKTAAFALPILQNIDPSKRETQALVLAPTRELAMQVAEAFHSYGKKLERVSVLPVYGGAPIAMQMKHLARGAQIVVGTPGRLIDHLDRETLKLGGVRMVVLDEADEMLKMGFIDEVERILSAVGKPRQVALFSATMPDEIARVAKRHLVDPVRIETERRTVSAPGIEQRFLNISEGQKLDVLTQMLEIEENDAVLIFRRTKNGAAELAEKLEARGFAAVAMHGDMNQANRESVIRRLKKGQIEIVVATDVAARGLDVEQISHVINYDMPHDVEVYVHRIGRTGRAGRPGVATLFVTPRERRMMRDIERFTGSPIKPTKMPTPSDVAARRLSVFKENLRKNLQEGELDLYVELVEQIAEEGPYDLTEVAAAAVRMANATRSLVVPPAAIAAPPAAHAPARDADDDVSVRLVMSVGKREGIRPADVVGSIANEADVPGREIGPIEIRDEVTYVTVPSRYLEAILAKVGRAKFRGKHVNLRVAGKEDSAPQRRAYGSSREGFAPPAKKPYAPRRYDTAPPRRDGPPPARRAPDRGDFAPRDKKPFTPRGKPGPGKFGKR